MFDFLFCFFFFFQAEDGIRDGTVTGVQTCALPISVDAAATAERRCGGFTGVPRGTAMGFPRGTRTSGALWWTAKDPSGDQRPDYVARSEEHTSEFQSQFHLVCRLLLEKKKIVLTES